MSGGRILTRAYTDGLQMGGRGGGPGVGMAKEMGDDEVRCALSALGGGSAPERVDILFDWSCFMRPRA